jgi:hypothetical protein
MEVAERNPVTRYGSACTGTYLPSSDQSPPAPPLSSPPSLDVPSSLCSSWVCNITSQRYSNSKRRYITQGMKSYRSTNLELLYAKLWAVVPRSYAWTRARSPCPHLRQSGSGGWVDCPVGNPVPPMSLLEICPRDNHRDEHISLYPWYIYCLIEYPWKAPCID